MLEIESYQRTGYLSCSIQKAQMDWDSFLSEEDDIISAIIEDTMAAASACSSGKGRISGSRPNFIRRHCSWYRDYLCSNPMYPPDEFRLRFRILLKLYYRLERDLCSIEPRLSQKFDAANRPGAFTWQKIPASLRKLADECS